MRCSAGLLLLAWVGGGWACSRARQTQLAATSQSPAVSDWPSDAAAPVTDAASDVLDGAVVPSDAVSWADEVRVGRWHKAARLLDALEPTEREAPEIRFLRGRVALALGDYSLAASLLQDTQTDSSVLNEQARRDLAEARLHAGPVEQAAAFFGARHDVGSLVKAAVAWEKFGDLQRARAAVDQAIRAAGSRSDRVVVDAHELRARLAQSLGDPKLAATDLRFVAQHNPSRGAANSIVATIAQLDPTQALTKAERIERAHKLARSGKLTEASEEMDMAGAAPGKALPAGQMAFAKAMTLYLGRARYSEAAELFERAAQLDRANEPQASWYAAKAWARADLNRRAAAQFDQLIRTHPRSPWTARSRYQVGRLAMLEARWNDAARLLGSYVALHPRGDDIEHARYERAVAELLSDHPPAQARKLLVELSDRARDAIASAHARHLQALAAHKAGDRQTATNLWRSVLQQRPLSWPALMSQARLASVSAAALSPLPALARPAAQSAALSLPLEAALMHKLGLDAEAEQYLHEHARQTIAPYGGRGGEALCAMYGQLEVGHRRMHHGQPFAGRLFPVSDSTRWAWDCAFPRPFSRLVDQLERQLGLPSGLVHSVMRQESGFDPNAQSPAGAIGLMQLLPSTAQRIAEESGTEYLADQLTSPGVSIELGARYLAKLLGVFRGNVPVAVAAYNAGPKAVGVWIHRAANLPLDLWVAQIPYPETRTYVWRVMENLCRYRYLDSDHLEPIQVDLAVPQEVEIDGTVY